MDGQRGPCQILRIHKYVCACENGECRLCDFQSGLIFLSAEKEEQDSAVCVYVSCESCVYLESVYVCLHESTSIERVYSQLSTDGQEEGGCLCLFDLSSELLLKAALD